MPEQGLSGPPRSPEDPTGERLDSWKEIAAYLKRGVTTAQRWEQEEALPVHRHVHEKRGSVYAFKSELDRWWENGHHRLANGGESGESPRASEKSGAEGPTLAERLRCGPLAVREALAIGRRIAEELAAAHEKGIVQGDLQPSTIELTTDGQVKLHDSGLAKAPDADRAAGDISEDSTETSSAEASPVLAAARYMSPEQARGEVADVRSDNWAFGCALYEMLAGKPAFPGATGTDVMAAIVEREPDWSALPAETPLQARSVLRRCLQQDRSRRLHAIADAEIELDEVLAASASDMPARTTADRHRRGRTAAVALLSLLAGAAASWLWTRPAPGARYTPIRLNIDVPPSAGLLAIDNPPPLLAISPDGSHLVYQAEGRALYIRALDRLEAHVLARGSNPFFSPDGRWVGFFADGKVQKVSVTGGAPRVIADAPALRGASWGDDGTIVYTPSPLSGLFRVSAEGGPPQKLTEPQTPGEDHRWPQVLPGGTAVLYTVYPSSSRAEDARVAVLSTATRTQKVLVDGATYGRYVPTGHLVYGSRGTVFAAPFNVRRLELTGPAVPVLEDVRMAADTGLGTMHLDFSRTGVAAYVSPYQRLRVTALLWVDRRGSIVPLSTAPRTHYLPQISPDGRRLVVVIEEPNATNLWVHDIGRQTWTQLTFGKNNQEPVWSPTGDRIAFSSNRAGPFNLFWMPVDGTAAERLTTSWQRQDPTDWSPDGQVLLFDEGRPQTGWDIWELPLASDHRPRPLVVTRFSEAGARFSPDGRWVAYSSNESGRNEVYVRPYPAMDRRWVVSTNGGRRPHWSRTGRELFYTQDDRTIMTVPVTTVGTFRAGTPTAIYRAKDAFDGYDVTPDGQHFLIVQDAKNEPERLEIVVVPNWFEELMVKAGGSAR